MANKFLLVFTFCVIFSNNVFAERAGYILLSAKTEKAKINIIGELHSFTGAYELKLDMNSAIDILFESDEIWIESRQSRKDINGGTVKNLEGRVSVEIWGKIKELVTSEIVWIFGGESARSKELIDVFMKEMAETDPVQAYADLAQLKTLVLKKKDPLNWLTSPGVYASYSKLLLRGGRASNADVRYLESSSALSAAWYETCSDADAEKLLYMGLQEYASNSFFSQKAQDIILSKKDVVGALNDFFLSDLTASLIYRCAIAPRNILWAKTFLARKSSASRISFVVGIGHLVGDHSLTKLLGAEYKFSYPK